MLAPAGATVGARIVSIRQFYGKKPTVVVDIKLETVVVGGVVLRLRANPEAFAFQKSKTGALRPRVKLGTIPSMRNRTVAFEFEMTQQPYLIAAGLESTWVTGNP